MPKLTLFKSKHTLTKEYWKDGTKKSPTFSEGKFEVKEVPDHKALKDLIETLNKNEALCYSVPLGFTQGDITLKGQEDEEKNKISRTKAYFDYPVEEGWLYIDVDEDIDETEVIKRLATLYEPFGNTSYVYATSASHGIGGKKGFHLYFKVNDTSIVKHAMDTLFNKAFNEGFGRCEVTKGGSIVNRTFFDKAVYDKGRLDFISGPICHDFKAPQRDIRVVQRANDQLDITDLLIPEDAQDAIRKERAKVEPEADKVCKALAKKKGVPLEIYKAMKDGGKLYPDCKILLENGTVVDVADILRRSMQGFLDEDVIDSEAVQHPVECGLTEKTKLYYNSDTGCPRIHSFAHGGQIWDLRDDGSVISGLKGPRYLLDSLRSSHGLAKVSQEAQALGTHPDTYEVLHMMLKTFLMEYHMERVLIDQWREMISLFLHLLDGHRGRYSIELPPSHGKTQVICHVILWLYKTKRVVPISLSVFKIDDIKEIQKWLLVRMDREWREGSTEDRLQFNYEPKDYLKVRHSEERTDFEELDKTPVIIHTHHVVRRNDFKDKFFSYKGDERHLYIFDEAMFNSLQLSGKVDDSLDHLNYAIERGENGTVKGLPIEWLKAFRRKLRKALGNLNNMPNLKDVTIDMPQLSERFVKTGYYLRDEGPQNFIFTLMNIGASDHCQLRLTREKGGKVLFGFKENDHSKFPRVITTDATRSVRKVHEYGNRCQKYPIEPYSGDQGVTYWMAPFKKTGRGAIAEDAKLQTFIVDLWLMKINPSKVLVITSKGIPVKLLHPNVQVIHWGQHKQTNEYRDCDAVIALNYFRKRGYHYKHDIYGEMGAVEPLDPGVIKEVEHGFIIDELLQGFCRGTMREGKKQNCLMFTPHNIEESLRLAKVLQESIRSNDRIELYEYPEWISALDNSYKTEQEKQETIRKTRSDRVYGTIEEREWAVLEVMFPMWISYSGCS